MLPLLLGRLLPEVDPSPKVEAAICGRLFSPLITVLLPPRIQSSYFFLFMDFNASSALPFLRVPLDLIHELLRRRQLARLVERWVLLVI